MDATRGAPTPSSATPQATGQVRVSRNPAHLHEEPRGTRLGSPLPRPGSADGRWRREVLLEPLSADGTLRFVQHRQVPGWDSAVRWELYRVLLPALAPFEGVEALGAARGAPNTGQTERSTPRSSPNPTMGGQVRVSGRSRGLAG